MLIILFKATELVLITSVKDLKTLKFMFETFYLNCGREDVNRNIINFFFFLSNNKKLAHKWNKVRTKKVNVGCLFFKKNH